MLDDYFSQDDRNRIQAIKAQLQWPCKNYHQGNRFKLVVNSIKQTHTIFFPTDTQCNPTFYHYLLELSRAFYTEKYGPVFGDVYFQQDTNKDFLSLYSSMISVAQHWFTACFCHANFSAVWEKSLDIKYKSIAENPGAITENPQATFSAALIIAQIAWIRQTSTPSLIGGSLQDMVNQFVRVDPQSVSTAQVAALVNGLIDLFQPGATLAYISNETSGFWEFSS